MPTIAEIDEMMRKNRQAGLTSASRSGADAFQSASNNAGGNPLNPMNTIDTIKKGAQRVAEGTQATGGFGVGQVLGGVANVGEGLLRTASGIVSGAANVGGAIGDAGYRLFHGGQASEAEKNNPTTTQNLIRAGTNAVGGAGQVIGGAGQAGFGLGATALSPAAGVVNAAAGQVADTARAFAPNETANAGNAISNIGKNIATGLGSGLQWADKQVKDIYRAQGFSEEEATDLAHTAAQATNLLFVPTGGGGTVAGSIARAGIRTLEKTGLDMGAVALTRQAANVAKNQISKNLALSATWMKDLGQGLKNRAAVAFVQGQGKNVSHIIEQGAPAIKQFADDVFKMQYDQFKSTWWGKGADIAAKATIAAQPVTWAYQSGKVGWQALNMYKNVGAASILNQARDAAGDLGSSAGKVGKKFMGSSFDLSDDLAKKWGLHQTDPSTLYHMWSKIKPAMNVNFQSFIDNAAPALQDFADHVSGFAKAVSAGGMKDVTESVGKSFTSFVGTTKKMFDDVAKSAAGSAMPAFAGATKDRIGAIMPNLENATGDLAKFLKNKWSGVIAGGEPTFAGLNQFKNDLWDVLSGASKIPAAELRKNREFLTDLFHATQSDLEKSVKNGVPEMADQIANARATFQGMQQAFHEHLGSRMARFSSDEAREAFMENIAKGVFGAKGDANINLMGMMDETRANIRAGIDGMNAKFGKMAGLTPEEMQSMGIGEMPKATWQDFGTDQAKEVDDLLAGMEHGFHAKGREILEKATTVGTRLTGDKKAIVKNAAIDPSNPATIALASKKSGIPDKQFENALSGTAEELEDKAAVLDYLQKSKGTLAGAASNDKVQVGKLVGVYADGANRQWQAVGNAMARALENGKEEIASTQAIHDVIDNTMERVGAVAELDDAGRLKVSIPDSENPFHGMKDVERALERMLLMRNGLKDELVDNGGAASVGTSVKNLVDFDDALKQYGKNALTGGGKPLKDLDIIKTLLTDVRAQVDSAIMSAVPQYGALRQQYARIAGVMRDFYGAAGLTNEGKVLDRTLSLKELGREVKENGEEFTNFLGMGRGRALTDTVAEKLGQFAQRLAGENASDARRVLENLVATSTQDLDVNAAGMDRLRRQLEFNALATQLYGNPHSMHSMSGGLSKGAVLSNDAADIASMANTKKREGLLTTFLRIVGAEPSADQAAEMLRTAVLIRRNIVKNGGEAYLPAYGATGISGLPSYTQGLVNRYPDFEDLQTNTAESPTIRPGAPTDIKPSQDRPDTGPMDEMEFPGMSDTKQDERAIRLQRRRYNNGSGFYHAAYHW